MKRTIIAAILVIAGVPAAHAQDTTTYTFKDVLKPDGQMRHGAAERVDVLACGASRRFRIGDTRALEKCMLARGWAVDQIDQEPEARVDASNRARQAKWDASKPRRHRRNQLRR
jgi:hypothetical protein